MPVQPFRLLYRKRPKPYACLKQVARRQLLKMSAIQCTQIIGAQLLHIRRESEIYAGFNQKGVRHAAIAIRPTPRSRPRGGVSGYGAIAPDENEC